MRRIRFVVIPTLLTVVVAAPVEASQGGAVYWANRSDGTIHRANLDGGLSATILSGLSNPENVAIDPVAGQVYWSSEGQGAIRRAALDGSGATNFITGLSDPEPIALDIPGGKVYWALRSNGQIERANLDGTLRELVFTVDKNVESIALDLLHQKIYWAQNTSDAIGRVNMDGTGAPEAIVTLTFSDNPSGVAVDAAAGKIYWNEEGGSRIRRANLDGTALETIVSDAMIPEEVALDLDAGKLYWTDRGTQAVYRADLDGSNQETLATGLHDPNGIDVISATIDPQPAQLAISLGPTRVTSLNSPLASEWVVPHARGQLLAKHIDGEWDTFVPFELGDTGEAVIQFAYVLPCSVKVQLFTESESGSNDNHARVRNSTGGPVYAFTGPPRQVTQSSTAIAESIGEIDHVNAPWAAWVGAHAGWKAFNDLVGWDPSSVDIIFPKEGVTIPQHWCAPEETWLPEIEPFPEAPFTWGRSHVLHEYGHHLQCVMQNGIPTSQCDTLDHEWGVESCPIFAFKEGWADFVQCVVDDTPGMMVDGSGNIETNPWSGDGGAPLDGCIVEGAVASILWDLWDSANEPFDTLGGSAGPYLDRITTVLEVDGAIDIIAFGRAFVSRYGLASEVAAIFEANGCDADLATDAPSAIIPTVLGDAYPNPFNPRVVIPFSLAVPGRVELTIYDLSGRRIRTLASGYYNRGQARVEWDGRDDIGELVSSGAYVYRIKTDRLTSARKLVLLK